MRVAGIMSGTSLDGIDVAVVDFKGRKFEVVAFKSFPYPDEVRQRLLGVSNCETHSAEVSRLNFVLPELYAKAVKRSGVPLDSLDLIGCHGQTIFHEKGNTLQIGDGAVLAQRCGVPVVSDFRTADIAAGGRGAPLVPFLDYMIYGHAKLGRVALNLGGIGNITAIPPAATPDQVIAFDTGPANMVIDQLVAPAKFDKGGELAAQGHVNQPLLDKLLEDPYFREKPPKTAGREQYGREFIAQLEATGLPRLDLIATVTAFTAATVAVGVKRHVKHHVDELIVSGGGVHNRTLMAYLQSFLPDVRLRTSNEFGIDSDAKEAIAFAVMAHESWHRRPSNVPSATGAKHPAILGKISYVISA